MIHCTASINQNLTVETTQTLKNERKTQTKKEKSQTKFWQPLKLWHFTLGCCKLGLYCIGRSSLNPKYIKNSSRANITILLFYINIPLYIKYINRDKLKWKLKVLNIFIGGFKLSEQNYFKIRSNLLKNFIQKKKGIHSIKKQE